MAKCQRCGKAPSFGHNVSFSKRHTNRIWRPNIQKTTLFNTEGKPQKVKVCTQCLRTLSKSK